MIRDFSRFSVPERTHSRSFSAYDMNGSKDLGHNRRADIIDEKAEAIAAAKRFHDEERRKRHTEASQVSHEKIERTADPRRPSFDELKRKAEELKSKQASNHPEMKKPETPIDSIEQDKKVGQNENTIATDEELKVQLENAKKANESAAAKNLSTDAKPEEILTAALNDIF